MFVRRWPLISWRVSFASSKLHLCGCRITSLTYSSTHHSPSILQNTNAREYWDQLQTQITGMDFNCWMQACMKVLGRCRVVFFDKRSEQILSRSMKASEPHFSHLCSLTISGFCCDWVLLPSMMAKLLILGGQKRWMYSYINRLITWGKL